MTDRNIESLLNRFGKPQTSMAVTEATLDKYRGKLPEKLLEYWQELGFCGFADGVFWLTNPDDYADSIAPWLAEAGLDQEDHYHVIARSGFGTLFLWGENNWLKYELDVLNGWLLDGDNANTGETKADEEIGYFLRFTTYDFLDTKDPEDEPLFKRCVSRHGALSKDEMFGFSPAMAMGGDTTLSSSSKVDIHVHMDLLKEFTPVQRMSMDDMSRQIWGATVEESEEHFSQQDTTVHDTRAEAGQACPNTGYWFTPAKENSRAYFERGDTMPEFSGNDWGMTIWQWDESQN